MKIKVDRKFYFTIASVFIILISSSDANAVKYPQGHEIKYLPPYCQARYNRGSETEKAMWKRRIGKKVWSSFHHYCQYVNLEYRYNKTFDKQERAQISRDTIRGMTKSISKYNPKTFVLMYEGYFIIGKAHARLGNVAAAITFYEKSIKLKPNFIRGYRELSKIYRKNGDIKSALGVIERGIKKVPKSKSLKRKRSELNSMLNQTSS